MGRHQERRVEEGRVDDSRIVASIAPGFEMAEIERLRTRLAEAEDLLAAIHGGGIDALVVPSEDGDRVFTLTGSDHAYRILIEAMSESAITMSPDGAILYCNQRASELLKVPCERLVGTSFGSYVCTADAGRFDGLLKRAANAAAASKGEVVLQAIDGAKIPVFVSMTSLMPHRIPGICLIVTDLTEQKRSQELLAVRERLELAQAAGRIGAFEWNLVDGTMHWTAELEALHGLKPGEFAGSIASWAELIHADDRGAVENALRASRESRAPLDCEFRVVWPDGSVHWMAAKGQVQCDAAGRSVRHLGVNIDITRRKLAEAGLAVKAEELARSNADLQHFATIASHDLQEPLRMISGYLSLLERRHAPSLDDSAKAFIGFARDGATRMSALIRALLAYSSLNAQAIDLVEIDLAEPLGDALANLSGQIASRQADIVHDPLPRVRADRMQMARLFQNLIANAIKFCRDSVPAVRISARAEAGTWIVSVSDDGIGIDESQKDRLFQMFQRLHSNDEFSGSGIGLAQCKRIAERHGGKIWVESRVGSGSCFSFSLPAIASSGQ